MDQTFARIDASLQDVRDEVRALRGDLGDEVRGLRGDLRDEVRALRGDFSALQDRLVQIGFGLVGVLIAALLVLIVALI